VGDQGRFMRDYGVTELTSKAQGSALSLGRTPGEGWARAVRTCTGKYTAGKCGEHDPSRAQRWQPRSRGLPSAQTPTRTWALLPGWVPA